MIRYQKNAVKVRKSDGTMVEVGLLGEGNSTQDLTNDVNRIETEINSLIGNEIATEKVGCVLYETGVFSTSANFKYSEYIPVAAGQFVIVKDCKCQGNVATIAYFNSNKVYDKSKSIPGITLSTENDYSAKIESDGFVVICRHKDNTNVIASVIANTKDIYDDLEEVKSKTDKMIAIDETPTADTEIAISLDEDLEECELVEKSELDEVKNDLSDLEDTVDTKVGYSEVVNNQLKMYRDSTKTVLLATLDLPVTQPTDVQINGTSITEDGVANIQTGGQNALGLYSTNYNYGTGANSAGALYVNKASNAQIDARTNPYTPVVPSNLPYAVKSAMSAPVSTTDPEWTDAEKLSARQRMGMDKEWVLKGEIVGDETDRGNIDTGVAVDLSGCTEIVIKGTGVATNTTSLRVNGNKDIINIFSAGSRSLITKLEDVFGCLSCTLYALNSSGSSLSMNPTSGKLRLDISLTAVTTLYFNQPSYVTSCNLKIYAR